MWAVEEGHTECARVLVEGGANMEVKNNVRDARLSLLNVVTYACRIRACPNSMFTQFSFRFVSILM
jgi:hypothetical protein